MLACAFDINVYTRFYRVVEKDGCELVNKVFVRNEIKRMRMNISKDDAKYYSKAIIEKLISKNFFVKSKTVFTYVSINKEVKTIGLINFCIEAGKSIAIPVTYKDNSGIIRMKPAQIDNTDFKKGYMSLKIPQNDNFKELSPERIDLVIVPGVAFDERGYRIGYGSGCYDRFLVKTNSKCIKIGLAYDFQVVKEIDEENHDIPMDYIITEKRMIGRDL